MKLRDELYRYETERFKARAIGLVITWAVCFLYIVVNEVMWQRSFSVVWHECIVLGVLLTMGVPAAQVVMQARRRRVTPESNPIRTSGRTETAFFETRFPVAVILKWVLIPVMGTIMFIQLFDDAVFKNKNSQPISGSARTTGHGQEGKARPAAGLRPQA